MDGANVNLKFFKEFVADFKVDNFHSHIVHGAFKTCAEKSGWGLKKFLKAVYTIFYNSPARREEYESVTGSSKYPLNFCTTR